MMHQKQKEPSADECQAFNDREQFFQAFEKPTQIYRYLSIRHQVHPIFLPRNLRYLKRCNRKANTRKEFHVDAMLDNIEGKQKSCKTKSFYKSEYLNLTFLGFVDSTLDASSTSIEVEVSLLKLSHNKRKEALTAESEHVLGRLTVPCNQSDLTPSKTRALSLSSDLFTIPNGQSFKSYVLNIRAWHRRKLSSTLNGCIPISDEEGETVAKKRRKLSDSNVAHEEKLVKYRASLTVYDRNCRCQLVDGNYEVALREVSTNSQNVLRKSTWEIINDSKSTEQLKLCPPQPVIRFHVGWNKQAIISTEHSADTLSKPSPVKKKKSNVIASCVTPRVKHKVVYRFVHGGMCHMETETDDCKCPWCALDCQEAYSLLKHLRLSHARLCFICTYKTDCVTRVDVTINEDFNGSYVGHPEDQCNLGLARCRRGPAKRTSVTQLIVDRSKKPSFDMSEFLEPEGKVPKGHLIYGHNRLYYHSATCEPKRAVEFNIDSEDENDPAWLRQKTVNLIDEFTDVNEAEMRLMKMWNLHVLHHNFIGDCHVGLACDTFLNEYGSTIISESLVYNFLLHLCNLSDFGLLSADTLHTLMMRLYALEDASVKAEKKCII